MYLENIMSQLKSAYPQVTIADSNVYFVDEASIPQEIICGLNRKISAKLLVPPYLVQESFAHLFEGGPSWIHANIVPTNKNFFLITLRSGALVGNPIPSINTSSEFDKVIIIMD